MVLKKDRTNSSEEQLTEEGKKHKQSKGSVSYEQLKGDILHLALNEKATVKDTSKKLGIAVTTVHKYVRQLKKEGKLSKDFSFISSYSDRDTENKIFLLVNSGNYDAKSVANILDISLPTVYHHVRSLKKQGKVPVDFSFKNSVSKEELKSKVYTLVFKERKMVKDIADELGVSDKTVYNYIEELKKEKRIPKGFSPRSTIFKEKIKENICFLLLQDNKTAMDVSNELGIGYSAVYRYINELKEEGRLPQDFGIVKKSREEAKEKVRTLALKEGEKLKDIANHLKLNELTIHTYVKELKDEGKIPQDFTFKGSTFNKEKHNIRQLALQKDIKVKDIASELGVSLATVHNYIKMLKEEGLLPKEFSFKRGRVK